MCDFDSLGGVRVGEDSWYIPNFLEKVGIDHTLLFGDLQKKMPWISRDARFMKYRGNEITRTKFFLTDLREIIRVYSYTGFQWESVLQYGCYKDYECVSELVDMFNGLSCRFNHVIGTLYKDGDDQIGYHSDKTRSWREGSSVAILSLGETREFHMKRISDEAVEVFQVKSGDLFILGWNDNQNYKHAIPRTDEKVGERISLCFRSIEEKYTRSEIEKKIAKSKKAREMRVAKKAAKSEEVEEVEVIVID